MISTPASRCDLRLMVVLTPEPSVGAGVVPSGNAPAADAPTADGSVPDRRPVDGTRAWGVPTVGDGAPAGHACVPDGSPTRGGPAPDTSAAYVSAHDAPARDTPTRS